MLGVPPFRATFITTPLAGGSPPLAVLVQYTLVESMAMPMGPACPEASVIAAWPAEHVPLSAFAPEPLPELLPLEPLSESKPPDEEDAAPCTPPSPFSLLELPEQLAERTTATSAVIAKGERDDAKRSTEAQWRVEGKSDQPTGVDCARISAESRGLDARGVARRSRLVSTSHRAVSYVPPRTKSSPEASRVLRQLAPLEPGSRFSADSRAVTWRTHPPRTPASISGSS